MNKPELVRYRMDTGCYSSLVLRPERRRKFLKVVVLKGLLRVLKVPLDEEQYMEPLPVSKTKARKTFRHAASSFGCTPQAKKIVWSF